MSLYLKIKKVSNVEFACQTNTETKSFTAGFNALLKYTFTCVKIFNVSFNCMNKKKNDGYGLIPRQLLILHGSFTDTQCSTYTVHFRAVGCPNFHSYKHKYSLYTFTVLESSNSMHCWTVDCNSSPYYYIFSTAYALSNVRCFPQHMLFKTVNVRCFPQHMLFLTVNVRCFLQHMLFPTVNVHCFPQHMLFSTVNVHCFPQHMLFSTVNVHCFPQHMLFSTVNVHCFPQHMLFLTVNVHCRFSYAL